MPSRFAFSNPGSAAVEELTKILAERDAKKRQDFLDSITLKRENRNDEIQRASLDSIKDQRASVNEERQQRMATGIAGFLKPGQQLDDETSDTLKKGNLGILVQKSKGQEAEAALNMPKVGAEIQGDLSPDQMAAMDGALTGSVTDIQSRPTKAAVAPGVQQFTGTPDQQKAQKQKDALQAFLDDPNTPAAVKQALQYEQSTGKTAPAGMFDKREPAKSATVQEYEYYRDEETKAGRTPKSFDEYQAMDANRKKPVVPTPTDGGYSPKQVVTFNQIAGAYERSPLRRASDRTIVLRDAAKRIQENPADAASQLQLAYSWIQALDTYQSAVREGELQLAGSIATRWQTLGMEANKIVTQGAVMPPDVARQMAVNANELIRTIESGQKQVQKRFASHAKVSGVGKMWDEFVAGMGDSPADGAPVDAAGASQTRTIRNPTTGETKTQSSTDGGKTWK